MNRYTRGSGSSRRGTAAALACLLVLAGARLLAAADFPSGLVLHFSFDKWETDGRVSDRTDCHHNGRLSGAKWTTDGRLGGGCEFAGSNQFLQVSNAPTLNATQATVAVWFKTLKADAAGSCILEKGMDNGYTMTLAGSSKDEAAKGKLCFGVGGQACQSDAAVADGVWHHGAGTYDGTTLKLYVDGQLQKQTHPFGKGPSVVNTNDLTFGQARSSAAADGKDMPYTGLLDEVMVFNRALSGDDIKAVIAATKPKFTKGQVKQRLAELKELYDRGLLLKDFYDRKVKECEEAE